MFQLYEAERWKSISRASDRRTMGRTQSGEGGSRGRYALALR
jgi:hypothetical protein